MESAFLVPASLFPILALESMAAREGEKRSQKETKLGLGKKVGVRSSFKISRLRGSDLPKDIVVGPRVWI